MYTTKQASELLGVSPRRITSLIKAGELKAERFGSAWAIDEESLEERLERPKLTGRPKQGEKDIRNFETYTLMHKNAEILDFVYNKKQHSVAEIGQLKDLSFRPFGIGPKDQEPNRYDFTAWIAHRYIPSLRPNLSFALRHAGVADAAELMFASWGLNLSDHYWFRPDTAQADWHDINYYENTYSRSLGRSLTGLDPEGAFDLHTPDSATPGALPKRWEKTKTGDRLIKGSSTHENREPYNELLATRLCARVLEKDDCLPYELIERGGKVFSSCPSIASTHTELIHAAEVKTYFGISEGRDLHRYYLAAGNDLGISDMQTSLDKMIVCDYLMVNFDRHLHNFGLLRDTESLEYRVAPLFDNGSAFFSRANAEELEARRYVWESNPFRIYPSQQLALVEDLSWFDPQKLEGFTDEMADILSRNKSLPERFIAASIRQIEKQIDSVTDLLLERYPLFPGFSNNDAR